MPKTTLTDEQREKHREIHFEAFQRNGTLLLAGFNRTGQHVYGGTVDDDVVLKRRARNKTARKSRRINRRGTK
jgi:hypothetical protein